MNGKRTGRRTAAVVAALAILGALALAADGAEMRRIAAATTGWPVFFALVATAVSAAAYSYGFVLVGRLFRVEAPGRALLLAGFVSTALGNLVSFGGATGHSVRVVALRRRGVAPSRVLGPSVFFAYLGNLALVALLPGALVVLIRGHRLSGAGEIGLGAVAGVLLLLTLAGAVALFHGRARRAILGPVERVVARIARGPGIEGVRELDESLGAGATRIRSRPALLVPPLLTVLVDWGACIAAMGFCFLALRTAVGPEVLVTGFAAGVAAGIVSMVPGGLGVQEGSMAGVYAALGVPFETALLASLLFRMVYYVVPYALALALSRRLLRPA